MGELGFERSFVWFYSYVFGCVFLDLFGFFIGISMVSSINIILYINLFLIKNIRGYDKIKFRR